MSTTTTTTTTTTSTSKEIKPKIEEIKDHSPFHQTITLGPFERGYGHTLGNSLRRVLLSGMPGFAATEVEIEGVDHPYTTLPGVAEDVIDMLLNLKEVAFKLEASNAITAEIDVKGPGEVTAANIKVPGQATVINKDHHIARLADDAHLKMKIKVEGGRGYLPAADTSRNKRPSVILLDAAFSPIRNVGIEVEEARVGSRTDLDRLVIDLKTNGVFSPDDLIRYAASILIEQLNTFADLDRSAISLDKIGRRDRVADNPQIYEPIDSLNVGVRVVNNLKQESIFLIGDLVNKSEDELKKTPRLGKKSIDEIKIALAELDLQLGMSLDDYDPSKATD